MRLPSGLVHSTAGFEDENAKSAITPDSAKTRCDLESGMADHVEIVSRDKADGQWYGGWKE